MRRRDQNLSIRDEVVYAAVSRELNADRHTREARSLIDGDPNGDTFSGAKGDPLLVSLRYVLTLLGLALPYERSLWPTRRC